MYRCCKPSISVGHNTLEVLANVKLQATGMTERCWPPRYVWEIEMSKRKIPDQHQQQSYVWGRVIVTVTRDERVRAHFVFSQYNMKTNMILESAGGRCLCLGIGFGTSLQFSLWRHLIVVQRTSWITLTQKETSLFLLALLKRRSEIDFLITTGKIFIIRW